MYFVYYKDQFPFCSFAIYSLLLLKNNRVNNDVENYTDKLKIYQ